MPTAAKDQTLSGTQIYNALQKQDQAKAAACAEELDSEFRRQGAQENAGTVGAPDGVEKAADVQAVRDLPDFDDDSDDE